MNTNLQEYQRTMLDCKKINTKYGEATIINSDYNNIYLAELEDGFRLVINKKNNKVISDPNIKIHGIYSRGY